MTAESKSNIVVLRRKQVELKTGLSRSSIYAKMKKNPNRPLDFDPSFPKPIHIGPKSVGWIETEINEWLTMQIEKSRGDKGDANGH